MKNHELLIEKYQAYGKTLAPSIIKLRRHFHRNPEVGHKEFQTTSKLKNELSKLGLQIFDGHAPTGLWAQLDTGKPGPVVAVRSDIDALPIEETSGLPYASKIKGFSHACGHDVHMAVLVGTAKILSKFCDDLRGKVKFLCQPAEEVPPGGANELIAAGVLKNPKVDAIVALHDDPTLPVGHIGIRDGVTMAAVFDFDIVVIGCTGHAALPHKAIDAIAIASHIITGLQQVVSRMVDPIDSVAISFGTIKGGTIRNGVAGEVYIEGTARSLSPSMTKKLPMIIKKAAVNIGRGLGAKVKFIPIAGYPLFESDARVNRFITDSYHRAYPKGKVHIVEKVLGAEDFASYLEIVPGAMFRLGVKNSAIGADKPWHHSSFTVDENAIEVGFVTMAATVTNLLYGWKGGKS
ncbi:MAG: amidohydrolase [candidate division Zixibacteria bacterium]|nr:amidohydrolase [candidate division Zixibacteria bacterium]